MTDGKIRNVAIVAHVDHGKTSLVDELLKSAGIFRENQEVASRIMDSNDLERERGITILSKNTAIDYKGYKINIIDTPGHADFGGEVERVLKMASAVVLVVDAFEGPMPQTRFVLSKAFDLSLPVIICINKIDRPNARPLEVQDEILDLFIDMGASDDYLDSPLIYASAKEGFATESLENTPNNMEVLLDKIIEYVPGPAGSEDGPFKILISTTDYNDYQGRVGIGKVERGIIRKGSQGVITNFNEPDKEIKVKIEHIYEFHGLRNIEVPEARVGSIISLTGLEGINVGDTLSDPEDTKPLAFVKISEPTLAVNMSVNDGPFAGLESEYGTSRQLKARLEKELETDVSLRVEKTGSSDTFKLSGRGELHLSVLIENMRREGYEFLISKPEVLYRKDAGGKILEPIETVTIDLPKEYSGSIIEELGRRKGILKNMLPGKGSTSRLIFKIPARGLIGFSQSFMALTRGEGIINTEFYSYEAYKGDIPSRSQGSLIAVHGGKTTPYGLRAAEARGKLFIGPGEEVYEGMIVGSSSKSLDVEVNVCRAKKQTNIRAAGADDSIILTPALQMSLEQMMDFIEDDELIEVTSKSLRLRKKILDKQKRAKTSRR